MKARSQTWPTCRTSLKPKTGRRRRLLALNSRWMRWRRAILFSSRYTEEEALVALSIMVQWIPTRNKGNEFRSTYNNNSNNKDNSLLKQSQEAVKTAEGLWITQKHQESTASSPLEKPTAQAQTIQLLTTSREKQRGMKILCARLCKEVSLASIKTC